MRNKTSITIVVLAAIVLLAFWVFETPATIATSKRQKMGLLNTKAQLPPLTEYTISEGQHFCMPRIFKIRNRPERVSWFIVFGENADYDLQDEDQQDWNKLCGLFYNFVNTLDNTVMVGWRYNKKTQRMELNGYYHVDKGRDFTKPLLEVALGEPVRIDILVDYEQKNYTIQMTRLNDGTLVQDNMPFTHDNTSCMEINTYFGGNESAPQAITIKKAYAK